MVSAMAKVKLGDVVKEAKLTFKGDKTDKKIVGLEHLIPENVTLSNWAENTENTFTKAFKKGHVLFGRRRAYLKKAVYAPFDGICSGDITVIEAVPEKIFPDLLPFIIQNDNLFAYAVENSAGGLSPRVKWEHLRNYEFDLPDMDEQKRLAKILWAIQNDITSKENAIAHLDKYSLACEDKFFKLHLDQDCDLEGYKFSSISNIAFIDPRVPNDLPETSSFIAMKDVSEDGKILTCEEKNTFEVRKGYTFFAEGDVLMAKITPCMENGKGALAENMPSPIGFGSTEFFVLRPKKSEYTTFLYALIMSKKFRLLAEGWMQGSAGQRRVSKDIFTLRKMWFPTDDEMFIKIGNHFKEIKKFRNELLDSIEINRFLLKASIENMYSRRDSNV